MSRQSLRETIGYRPMGLPDFTPRRRSFWAVSTSLMAGNGLTELPVSRSRGSHPLVREIHKNAFLKRQTSTEKKGTPFSKKGEKFWVVFCVHDDVEAFLEFYSEPKMATIHKPLQAISLNSCLHVSPSIMGQDNEYQFAVTLPTEVIRLVAANWEQMIEWVESLQGKLREMNILSPKDNLYSKLPEMKQGTVASTRDPNSPLPPTPSTLIPGLVQSQRPLNQNIRSEHRIEIQSRETSPRVDESISNIPSRLSVNGNTPSPQLEENPRNNHDTHYDTVFASTAQPSSTSPVDPQQSQRKPVPVRVTLDVTNMQRSASGNLSTQHRHLNGTSSGTTVLVVGKGDVRFQNSSERQGRNAISASVTIRCSSSSTADHRNGHHFSPENPSEISEDDTRPLVPVVCKPPARKPRLNVPTSSLDNGPEPPAIPRVARKSTSSDNIYEHIYLPDRDRPNENSRKLTNGNYKTRSQLERRNGDGSPEEDPQTEVDSHARRIISGGCSQRSSSVGRIEIPSTSTRIEHNKHVRRNDNKNGHSDIRSSTTSTFTSNEPSQLEGNPIDALIDRLGEYRLRRNQNSDDGTPDTQDNDNQTNSEATQNETVPYVPLKEQQVMHLLTEINHPGGVRITLRKKDCINSIAFIDYLGAVWVAGWKQTQFPVLYYAFHVGDQILTVAGVTVQNSQEAIRAIKMVSSMQVEFIIRRLPYGRVFALKRSRDGEPLGLVAEGGSGEISEVLRDGLAAQYGLPPKGISLDGQTPCNWYLTEVNNRPLSLMSKNDEVKDRLNAVGKEVSITVNPSDLVKHLRKGLKSYKGFKDYVVG